MKLSMCVGRWSWILFPFHILNTKISNDLKGEIWIFNKRQETHLDSITWLCWRWLVTSNPALMSKFVKQGTVGYQVVTTQISQGSFKKKILFEGPRENFLLADILEFASMVRSENNVSLQSGQIEWLDSQETGWPDPCTATVLSRC